ncbi:MAG: hypothetical protein ED557_02130 [Balneola sp.]|nr:MAG: hypothetical protein ED557_02130 [Balneola sp.]
MKAKFVTILILAVGFGITSAEAQYFPFGKNRVQYENFEWRFIQSKHFDIYYYGEKNYELAEFSAQSLESAYKQLSEDFNHEIVSRIPLIVYDSHNDFSQTNVVPLDPTGTEGIGGVTDKWKNRMTVPFMGDYNDFRRTLHHELVHAVFNDMFYGGNIQSIIQNNIQLVFPLWFEEGLAEYTALGWDTNTDMFIRDAVINGYLPPIRYLRNYYAYRGGQSVWNFIVEEYGREKIAEILNRIKTSRSIEYGFADALGLTIDELSERWEQSLKERYFPEVAERESAKSISTLMTRRGEFGTYNTSPTISPQGDRIAFITNGRGYFDVIVIDALNGRKLKTLVRGEDNPDFEELNILNPNITWSPDGEFIALSTKRKGKDDIALVNYRTKEVEKLEFETIDAIESVAWSPDGRKIAFDGNIGPYQDIFVYNFDTEELTNLTQDFFSDFQPAWSSDSESIFFVSDRGEKIETNTYKTEYRLLADLDFYQTDIYQININTKQVERITASSDWSEKQPAVTRSGRLTFNSDENGIQNIYEYDFETKKAYALTDLQAGVSQFSMSADGSRIAIGAINEGYLDIFLLKSPFSRKKTEPLVKNYWAQRRVQETQEERVPATLYAREMFDVGIVNAVERTQIEKEEEEAQMTDEERASTFEQSGEIDFRNYVFSEEVILDSTLTLIDEFIFDLEDNVTDDGRYVPRDYRLRFSTDVAYSPSVGLSTYGAYAPIQFLISDLLGDHQLSLGSNFQTDLRNSNYSIQYGYLKKRTNVFLSYFHSSRQYQTFGGELLRFRTFGGGLSLQYPIDKFRRVDASLTWIGLTRDYNVVTTPFTALFIDPNTVINSENLKSSLLYPQVTYTKDATLNIPGFITPMGGTRYSIGISGSPGVGEDSPAFASVLGDFRRYFNIGLGYSLALRGSSGASFGRDSQTYFLGGMLGWINQRWSDNGIPLERLADTFFTLPAVPLRGHEYNTIYGNKFALINTEFRFPLFAALVPGAVPILPLYNITGAFFIDVGTAWGQNINVSLVNLANETINFNVNDADLSFRIGEERIIYYDEDADNFTTEVPTNGEPIIGNDGNPITALDGDILIGSGFGLRTIVFGLPFRYDIGWSYGRNGFEGNPIHYFSIGIDF